MNTYAERYIDKWVEEHPTFTTWELVQHLKTVTPKQTPPIRELAHGLSTRPDLEYVAAKEPYWRRIDLTAPAESLLHTVWIEGAVPMHELRANFGPAVDEACSKGMILRAEGEGKCDYLLTRRGISYVRGLTA